MEKQQRLQHLQYIREYELQQAVKFFPRKGKVLEIGAGSGWQAQRLTEYGYEVIAIDIPNSQYSQRRVFPVILYDGKSLPFSDNSFDIVFSSNVLEHISDPITLNKEFRRVLCKNGTAVHVVPTSFWRFWTILTHHIYISRLIFNFISKKILGLDKEVNNIHYSTFPLSYLYI